ncbi:MAG: phosphoribosyltransferase [Devosia sp.]
MFTDRREAGQRLAVAVAALRLERPLVLALPRGGVPVAFEVAQHLGAPLDIVLVRKLAAPGQPELGIGAMVDGEPPQVVLNAAVMADLRPPESHIAAETARQLGELERRRQLYRGDVPAQSVADRTIVLVDDGVATGSSAQAALRGLRQAGARRLVLAVPVGAADAMARLEALADEVVCLVIPVDFQAVGQWFMHFAQTGDDEVIQLLATARQRVDPT